MRSGTIAILLGVLLLAQTRALPGLSLALLLPLASGVTIYARRWRWPALLACGFLWALIRAHIALAGVLPKALEGEELLIEGTVASIPAADQRRVRFDFEVQSLLAVDNDGSAPAWRGRIRLSWYGSDKILTPGERWRFWVRLKRPHGFMNPGAFDYERWLFSQRIHAVGYVRDSANARRMSGPSGAFVLRARERLLRAIESAIPGHAHLGMVAALAIGDRAHIDERQWKVLRATGTSHLMAISGLHIGLVAGFAFAFMRWLWPLLGTASTRFAAPRAAAGLASAFVYALLAGFSVPTQRALLMVGVVMASLLLSRHTAPSTSLALALLGVLVLDPFSVLSPGFWLSFGAVAVILYGMRGRSGARATRGARVWRQWIKVQWLVALGLAPITLLVFHQQPLVSPLANLAAVPWVANIVVPLVLLGTALQPLSVELSTMSFRWGAGSLALIWPAIEWLAELDWIYGVTRAPSLWMVGAALLGATVLLLPRGAPVRWLGVVGFLPLVLVASPVPVPGAIEFTLLDVGQGLAAVVRTHDRVLVYDVGPRYGARFDAGEAVLVPFLKSKGVKSIDVLVLSHGDNDHVGGLRSVLAEVEVKRVLSNDAELVPDALPCLADTAWRWGEVDFELLFPVDALGAEGNNRSCVLRVSSRAGSILLPGDIEWQAERDLVSNKRSVLRSDILVVPHHGSRTSSSPRFLDAVQPSHALFAVGYANRFGFPRPSVRDRYRARAIQTYDSARHGAISFTLQPGRGIGPATLYRFEARRFWHHR